MEEPFVGGAYRRAGVRMFGRLKTTLLGLVVGAAALVPLFGDPRVTPLTHPLWARMLLRALDMTEAVESSSQASQVFATLSWRDSLSYPADRYLRADGALVREEGGQREVAAAEGPAEVVYPLAVVQSGDYLVRLRLAGDPAHPATAEVLPMKGGSALKTFTFVPAGATGWVLGGSAFLDPGAYTASVLLPPGTRLAQVEVAPPCVNPIEPVGGWKPAGVTTQDDLAVTSLKAMDQQNELPPADTPLELSGADFQLEPPAAPSASGLEAMTLKAGPRGVRASVSVEIPAPGLYTLSAFVNPGNGQRWLADACRKAIVCPGSRSGWRAVMTQPFSKGRHTLTVALADGAAVERLRLERKKDSAADYVATIRRLGLDPGPVGPVTRDKALEAMRFIRDRRRQLLAQLCGDAVRVEEGVAPLAQQLAATSAAQPAAPAAPSVPNPLGPVMLPPQEPASPVVPAAGGPPTS